MLYKNYTRPDTIILHILDHTTPISIIPKKAPSALSLPQSGNYLKFTATVTAYNSSPDQTDATPYLAAWNNPVYDGMIAVSRDLERLGLSRGVKVEIDGVEFVIDDRMHRRKKRQFDIWMEDKEDAENWGRQRKEVIIRDPNAIVQVLCNVDGNDYRWVTN